MADPSESLLTGLRDKRLALILGGARSGKSAFAQELARREGRRVVFLATAAPGDEEMARRIAAHRAHRPAGWRTVEAERHLARALRPHLDWAQAVVVDCITLLASNVLPTAEEAGRAQRALDRELAGLLAAYRTHGASFFVVSNEVGAGTVPEAAVSRAYRDLLGRANQRLAAAADGVYLLVAGIPMEVKGAPKVDG